jgi:hypothetical protein
MLLPLHPTPSSSHPLSAHSNCSERCAWYCTIFEASDFLSIFDRMSSIYSNLAGHISGYAGHAQISTLMFLLDKANCPQDAEFHVVSMLEKLCKEQRHTILYSKLMHEYSGNAAISALFEKQWPMDRDSENRKEYSILEQQLTEKRNQALKEEVMLDIP